MENRMADEREQGVVIAFRASAELMDNVKAAAAKEGTRSDVARRALIRDLKPTGFAGAKSGLLTGQEMDRPGKCETLKMQSGYSDAI
jgi:hypothetical protein